MFAERLGSAIPGADAAAAAALAPGGGLQLAPPFASLSFALGASPCPFSSSSSSSSSRGGFGPFGRRAPPPFASLGVASSFGAAQKEPATGILYPQELCVLTSKHCPQLAGVGVRAKRILGLKNINVYSVGLYVDGAGAKKALHKYKGFSVDGLLANQKAFDELVDNTHFEKSLRLVISFGSLKRATFLSALEERLKPALDKAKEPAATMKAFEGLFDGVDFRKGLDIAFATHHKGQLVTKIDGKKVGSIQSPALVKALFDIYVGPDPVSSDAKKAIGKGLAALLNE